MPSALRWGRIIFGQILAVSSMYDVILYILRHGKIGTFQSGIFSLTIYKKESGKNLFNTTPYCDK